MRTIKILRDEIKEFALGHINYLFDYDSSQFMGDIDYFEIHNKIFNEQYFVVGWYAAKEWMGEVCFDVISEIQDYERINFGEIYTDFSDPEQIANKYAYIVGAEIINQVVDEYLESFPQNDEEELIDEV
jgi:hypothetical protein